MYGALVVTYALLLIGPASLAGGYRPTNSNGLLMVLMMSLAAAVALGLILGRWIYQRPAKDPDAAD